MRLEDIHRPHLLGLRYFGPWHGKVSMGTLDMLLDRNETVAEYCAIASLRADNDTMALALEIHAALCDYEWKGWQFVPYRMHDGGLAHVLVAPSVCPTISLTYTADDARYVASLAEHVWVTVVDLPGGRLRRCVVPDGWLYQAQAPTEVEWHPPVFVAQAFAQSRDHSTFPSPDKGG